MSENTPVGPAGSNKAALPVKPFQTKGHLDNTSGGSDESGNQTLPGPNSLSPVNP